MKQDHTEESIAHTEGNQNTGNHKKPSEPDAKGADRVGGSRAGSENVESTQSGPDVERLRPLDEGPTHDVTGANGPSAERAPERDERGRI